ncbi:hypothetical protein GQ44DRAFT_791370 [Phaeosphaeriaceae sp. PMI808]|nr:hypothetical protein GQ44DRAFT_791370 [Phaeosphaeriaceae sp. PMI808]
MSTNSTTTVNLNESRAGKVTTVIILCPALALATVLLRLYTRFVIEKKRFLEDYSIVLAMSSIMLQYVRISVMRFEKRLCYAILVIVVIQHMTTIVVNLNYCRPFKALWNPRLPGAKCLNWAAMAYAPLSLTIAMDIIILILPAIILRHLTLRWYQKFGVAIILSLGGLACVVSILRLTSIPASTRTKDPTWDKVYSGFYGVIEPNTGIFCCCIVTLRPLFRRHFPFVSSWLDGLSKRHVSLNSWKSHLSLNSWKGHFGRAPTPPRPNTTKGSSKVGLAREVELTTVKDISSVETQSVSARGLL